jgi:ribose transport system substrate-binding protein
MKVFVKKMLVSLLASAVAFVMAAGAAQAEPKKTIALVTNVAADFWTVAGRGLGKAQKQPPTYNVELIVISAAPQRHALDDLQVRGVAGVSISVDNAQHAKELNKVAANTSLITTDSDAPQSNHLA